MISCPYISNNNMKSFWFKKQHKKSWNQQINIGFAVLWFICFLLFSVVSSVQNTVKAEPNETLFEKNFGDLALYVSPYDARAASVLLSIQRIVNWYEQKQDYLKTYRGDIENVLQYISNKPSSFSQLGLQEYKPFLDFLSEATANKDDIFSLLGSERPQTYLIALQNGAEKRPNGWFFWSFIKVTIFDAHITDIKLIDSYMPGVLRPDVAIRAPEWANHFLSGENKITFLASNKFWFTDMDGANIKKIYDIVYGEDVRGVILVNSNLFAEIIPWFQEYLREWQFENASIDLIRGANLPNKKELYFQWVNELIQKQPLELAKAVIKNFDYIQNNRYIQAHLVRVQPEFQSFLKHQKITTVFDNNHIFLWDYNSSFNKIDWFIKKNITILDAQQKVVYDGWKDVVPINNLLSGEYTMYIQYAMNVPDSYKSYIDSLVKEYWISLNLREKHILALIPQWSTRGVIYAPKNITFSDIQGKTKTDKTFVTPFSNNAFYILENTENNSIKEVVVKFVIE